MKSSIIKKICFNLLKFWGASWLGIVLALIPFNILKFFTEQNSKLETILISFISCLFTMILIFVMTYDETYKQKNAKYKIGYQLLFAIIPAILHMLICIITGGSSFVMVGAKYFTIHIANLYIDAITIYHIFLTCIIFDTAYALSCFAGACLGTRKREKNKENLDHDGSFGHVYTEKKNTDYEHVPLYRSYGVFRKFGLPRKILETFYKVLATLVLALLAFAAALTIVTAIIYAPVLISTAIVVIIASFILYKPVRLLHKRFRFMRKLKRVCRKNGHTLIINRRFPKYFVHNKEQEDFCVDTGRKIYYGCFLTIPKRLTHVTFLDEKRIRLTTRINAERNKFYQIYDLQKKHREKEFYFPYVYSMSKRPVVKVVILNPSPHAIFVKDKDGVERESGTGEFTCGYYIHTGSGFVNTIERETKE